jgi:zinc/manganese transport system ATP-binding protein
LADAVAPAGARDADRTVADGPAILLDDVSVARGGHVIWSHGTMTIARRSMVAAIGPNGSGKTTLLEALLGLLPTASGRIEVLGRTPHRGDDRVGYVPQNYTATIGDAVRARDLVALGLAGRRWGLGPLSADDRRRIDEALAAVGASAFADRRMSQLSGGQQQRVAIAQALVDDPEVLLLDEPLANLDLRNQREIVDLLSRLRVELGVTVVVVVHDLNPLLSVLDGAIYLLDGHAHYGAIGAVVDEELLTHLYGTQVRVVRTPTGDLFTRSAP